MAGNPDKIVIDTNLRISFLISDTFSKIDVLLKEHRIRLLFSPELILEFIDVARRPKFMKLITQNDLKNLLNTIGSHADFIRGNFKSRFVSG